MVGEGGALGPELPPPPWDHSKPHKGVDIKVITYFKGADFENLWNVALLQFFGHIFLNNGPI